MVELALVSLHGRLDPGRHAVVHDLPQKLECQDVQMLAEAWGQLGQPERVITVAMMIKQVPNTRG